MCIRDSVVDRVEDRASEILGYEYTLDGEVTYDFALTEPENITPTAQFETYLFDQIGEVMKNYVLTVNGEFIGAAQDRACLLYTSMQLVKKVDHDRCIGGAAHTGGSALWGPDSVAKEQKGERF